jgi:C4-dicarboxylate transporter
MTANAVTAMPSATGTAKGAAAALVAGVAALLMVPGLPDAAVAAGWSGVALSGVALVLALLRIARLSREVLTGALALGLAAAGLAYVL